MQFVAYFGDAVVFHWLGMICLQFVGSTFLLEPLLIALEETVFAAAVHTRAQDFGYGPCARREIPPRKAPA